MDRTITRIFVIIFGLVLILTLCKDVQAQAVNRTLKAVTCNADGSSIEVLAANGRRLTFTLINLDTVNVRIGYLSGSSTVDLTTSNSVILSAGSAYGESFPTVWLGRIVCMSTDALTRVIQVVETRK